MKESMATKLLSSISSDHLVILCGAGLSMASPSELPSANQLLVPWGEFYGNPNDGHYAIADFLICKAVDFTVSTNFDILIKSDAVSGNLNRTDY